jgi:peroxiredoxin-like protein
MSSFKVAVKWKNTFTRESYVRDFTVYLSGNQQLQSSSAPEYSGNENMTNPEELLASALASCHMLTFLAICSKSGHLVESYEDNAVATLDKNAEGKMAVTEITLHPKIIFTGDKIPDSEKIKSFHDKAHHNCFIANSIKCHVEVVSQP